MVELCELKLMSNGVDCWPPDIDQHVAQLDFDNSASTIEQGMFASIVLDPSIILSTDSLMDGETLRMRCENNKNDYKLTFEDSGQWTTTSGIGGSVTTNSPPTPARNTHAAALQHLRGGGMFNKNFGLRLMQELNNEVADEEDNNDCDGEKRKAIDSLLNNAVTNPAAMTTWGRIPRSGGGSDPPYEDKTFSLPELHYNFGNNASPFLSRTRPVSSNAALSLPAPSANNRNASSSTFSFSSFKNNQRPPSLLANFVGQQQQQLLPNNHHQGREEQPLPPVQTPGDYEYREVYLGDGRYVDVNENEIGFVPPNTDAIQRVDRWRIHNAAAVAVPSGSGAGGTRYAHATLTVPAPGGSGGSRTFADLSPSQTAPDLKFLSLQHKMPSFCRSSISLDNMINKAKKAGLAAATTDYCNSERLLCDAVSSELLAGGQPDSGLGASSSSSGPAHIEDWASLAVLLPRHVVDACSFFKTNSSLLTATNNIERKQSRATNTPPLVQPAAPRHHQCSNEAACRTCFSVRRRLHPPSWAQPVASRYLLCDCSGVKNGHECCCANTTITTSCMLPGETKKCKGGVFSSKLKLHSQELSIIGLPIYAAKRNLVERVVEGVAEIARGASSVVLWSALERLLADGLSDKYRPWNVVVELTRPGPVTGQIFQLVKSLEAGEKPENSRIDHFFKELLKLHSLDGWLGYVVLKTNVLSRLYTDTAFLLRANTAYRSLFWRLIESLELLSVLAQCHRNALTTNSTHNNGASSMHEDWGSASRLPADSRVPKSSSVPARLRVGDQFKFPIEVLVESEDESNPQEAQTKEMKTTAVIDQTVPSTSLIHQNNQSATSFKSCASSGMRSSSRIPVVCFTSNSPMRNVSRQRSRSSLHQQQPSSTTTPLSSITHRSSSLRSRQKTPYRVVAKVREAVSPSPSDNNNAASSPKWLPLDAGEKVQVLSIRGQWSRCCRLNSRHGMITNGAVPTHTLDLF